MNSEVEGAIYEVALSLEDTRLRQDFLARTYRDDPTGLARMTSLVASASESTSFFLEARDARGDVAAGLIEEFADDAPVPISVDASASARIGSTIGGYHLIRTLGEGGSGIVYEAEQREPVQRRVALKIFRIDAGNATARARFDVERQALAIMNHPCIAKVLDVGGVDHGSPYFVLELVQGESITSYCDRQQLSIKQRIQLFIEVCDAIQHAHSKGIIHRDIKPSNVLVSGPAHQPVAKVIDFGIAKAVASHSSHLQPHITAHDQFVGTPAYMSPEQVEMIGVDIDTRSDIYSLGVLLYELLTSHTPFHRKALVDSGMAAMRKMILDHSPPKPSAQLTLHGSNEEQIHAIAAARQTDPIRLITSIQGDLDWVIMKALEKDRNRRYETADSLAMDLRRHLENQPVSARRPTNAYTFGKFVQRNRVPFYSSVAVALSILLGFGVSTMLYFREKEALNEQERLSREAQLARDQELQLRRQAQARVNVSQVAFLLAEGKVQEADALLQQTPLISIEPSKEAATVFRTLGNWYATYGRWAEANQCYRLLAQATKMSRPEELLRSTDLLITAPAFLELGDQRSYNHFREEILQRFLPVNDSLQAEHLLKVCLITKVSTKFLNHLAPAARICEQRINDPSAPFPPWEAFSLALYHHRKGEPQRVIEIGNRALAAPDIRDVCAAVVRVLLAMAYHKLHNREAATSQLQQATTVLRQPKTEDPGEEKAIFPKWYDWSIANFLLSEAETMIAVK